MEEYWKLKWEKEEMEAKIDRMIKDAPWILDNEEDSKCYPEEPVPWDEDCKMFSSSEDEVIDFNNK